MPKELSNKILVMILLRDSTYHILVWKSKKINSFYFINRPTYRLVVGTSGRNPITFDNWNNSKILAYWKYDDATKPGKDSHSWLGRLNNIRTALQGQQGDRRLRLGIAGGEWKR